MPKDTGERGEVSVSTPTWRKLVSTLRPAGTRPTPPTEILSSKNLAAALAVEAAELLEHFQWLTDAQSHQLPPELLPAGRTEVADVRFAGGSPAARLPDAAGSANCKVERGFRSACGSPARRLPDAAGSANCKFYVFLQAFFSADASPVSPVPLHRQVNLANALRYNYFEATMNLGAASV